MEPYKICRLCLTKPLVSYSLLDMNGASILESLTSIKINKEDNLPKRACLKCWLNIKLAYRIQQNILEADKKLKLIDIADSAKADDEAEEVMDIVSTKTENIKQEQFDIVHKSEPDDCDDEADDATDTEYHSIKVENLTESEVLIICQADVNKENLMSFKIEEITSEATSPCHICGVSLNEDKLIEHLKIHYSTRLKCDECNTYCENITSYRRHVLSKHKDMQKSWICRVCSASFQYKPLYKIHIEKAHVHEIVQRHRTKESFQAMFVEEYKYDCPYCNRKFKNEARSLAHIKTHNKKECPVCKIQITPANFKVHVDSHSSHPVVCHLCGVTYKNPTSLRSHIYYTHSTRKYICKYCKKVFKKAYDLPLHIKKEHTGERDHVCDICGKSFFAFHNLNKHKKMTHMKLRPFQCQYCKKTFSSKHSLRTHERQHTNITPYACEVCGEGFRQNVSLKAHKKSKHNIVEAKTCECNVCGKKFGSRWAVLSHMRIH